MLIYEYVVVGGDVCMFGYSVSSSLSSCCFSVVAVVFKTSMLYLSIFPTIMLLNFID